MEIDDPKLKTSDQISNPKFSINVLQLLKFAQLQHGLRFGDYTRYRRYCTARLRRLYKSLKFTHGRGKYNKRAITATTVSEVRFLHMILYTSERAWSHAMEKRQLPDGPNARQRNYLICRLRKAVKWATLFSELCSMKGDSRTSLEAEAYASYMRGNLLFEQDQNWDVALKCFKKARKEIKVTINRVELVQVYKRHLKTIRLQDLAVYEELGKYGDLENQVLCRERVEELGPSIQYCLHKVGESDLQTSDLMHIGEMEGTALDLFKAKLEAVMDEARSQQAASMTEFHWLGHIFPIANAKTRVFILKAQELEKDLHGQNADSVPQEKKLAIFDKVFAAYNEARTCIRNDLVTAGNSESMKDDLNGLDKAIGAVLGQRTIERNLLLVSIAKSKLLKLHNDKNDKVTRPEELVRLFDLLLQNTSDLSDLISSGRDRKPEEISLEEECEIKSFAFRAERCFYLAKSYSSAGKRSEAYALYCRAHALAEDAIKKLQALTTVDQVLVKQLKMLSGNSRSSSCIEHAMGIIEEERAPDKLSKKISKISLTGAVKKVEDMLCENLESYESAVGDSNTKGVPRIEVFPPAFQSVPRNPIIMDLAFNVIEFPSLDDRMRKKGGLWNRFFQR